MNRFHSVVLVLSVVILSGWQMAPPSATDTLRIAIIGDAEPKPLAEFPHMAAAVAHINEMAKSTHIEFVMGVGDIAHKGTVIQYEAATEVLTQFERPFYPIMGNEEHGSTVERYLHYANQWNSDVNETKYVLEYDRVAFIFASPDHGREFRNSGSRWILNEIKRHSPKPVILVVHGAQKGVYPENSDKGIGNRIFHRQVITQPNLAVVISGDLHMDMDRVDHSKKVGHVQYLHMPALERTKIPDETNHTPMIRMMSIHPDGNVIIDTYIVGETTPLERHAYSFSIKSR